MGSKIDDVFENSISIYPNPVENELNMAGFENPTGLNLQILDIAGKIILIPQFSFLNSINASGLPSGVYFLKIKTDSQIITKNLSKNKLISDKKTFHFCKKNGMFLVSLRPIF